MDEKIDYKQMIVDRLIDVSKLYTVNNLLNVCFPIDYMLERYGMYPKDRTVYDCLNGYTDVKSISGVVGDDTGETGPIWKQYKTSQGGVDWATFMDRIGIYGVALHDLATVLDGTTVKQLCLDALINDKERTYTQLEAARIFLERLGYYQSSEHHNDKDLWYLAFNGRLAKCSYLGEKRWAQTHLDNGDIIWDSVMGFYVAVREINGEGCSYVRHRPKLTEMGAENWNTDLVNKIEEYFDGGSDCKMIIDKDFRTAYEPSYDDNQSVLGKDLVCGYSCMSGRGDDAESFYGSIEGCWVVRFEDSEGEQVGRCIMYEYNGIRHFIRLYAKKEYQNRAYAMIKAELRDDDLFGREEEIDGLELPADFDENTSNMYLDGYNYGLSKIDGRLYITTDPDKRMCETDDSTLFNAIGICVCEHCGEVMLHSGDGFKLYDNCGDDHYFCSPECAEEDGWVKCDECDEWINKDDALEIDGYYFCDDRCADSYGYKQCNHCHEWCYTRDCDDDDNDYLYTIDGVFYCSKDCCEADGFKIDEITGKYTNDYIQTTTGSYVDANKFIKNRDKYTIKVSHKKQTKDDKNETNND